MKVTKTLIQWFEKEQRDHGTKTALHNLLWVLASDLLKDLGITRIRTSKRAAR